MVWKNSSVRTRLRTQHTMLLYKYVSQISDTERTLFNGDEPLKIPGNFEKGNCQDFKALDVFLVV